MAVVGDHCGAAVAERAADAGRPAAAGLSRPQVAAAGLSRPQVAAAQLHAEVAGRPFTADRWLTGAADRAHGGPEQEKADRAPEG
ncbi:hypothetical protein OHA72_05250 [Dactylosporangium sp. NBC_01737]|uniref:hypothetical protein n=1 Tax=Dactylosporangium sp. NBC_01737 TaxID=2975959 RepID=UPI002E165D1A|nr:hypothetical protein OHA72_05250 [Dactylosporangium sp. NBC_01737]